MAADFELIPLYGQQPIVRNRTSAAMNFWAGQTLAQEIPETKPDEKWVRARILADRVTRNPNNYLDPSLSYYTQQDAIQASMRDLMDGFPTQTERDMFTNSIMVPTTPVVMEHVAAFDVLDQAVQDWYNANGFVEPPPEALRDRSTDGN
jgi:hypothetical protein